LLTDYTDLRRNRIQSEKSFLAKPMWAALIISAILLILFSALFKTKNIRIHAVMIALVGGSLGVMFFLLVIYNNPFWGPSAIEPTPFKKTLESISIIKR
jgi:xanthine/uracil permease